MNSSVINKGIHLNIGIQTKRSETFDPIDPTYLELRNFPSPRSPPMQFKFIDVYKTSASRVFIMHFQIAPRDRMAFKTSLNAAFVLVKSNLQWAYSASNILKSARAGKKVNDVRGRTCYKGLNMKDLNCAIKTKLSGLLICNPVD